MSLSAKDRSPDNNGRPTNSPSSHDWLKSAEDRDITKEQASGSEEDSLVEHILDFLDKYPAFFTRRASLTECMRVS